MKQGRKLFRWNSMVFGAVFMAVGFASAAPVISNIQVGSIGLSSVIVSWDTDVPATSQVVQVDTTFHQPARRFPEPLDLNLVLHHSVTLTGLSPATLCAFYAASQDAGGAISILPDATNPNGYTPFFFTTIAVDPAVATDFRIDTASARHVYAGSDLYLALIYTRLGGPAAKTLQFGAVTGLPAGASAKIFRTPDVPDNSFVSRTELAEISDGTQFFVRVKTSATTPAGNYTLILPMTLNGVARPLSYAFTVEATPTPISKLPVASIPAIPGLQHWEDVMLRYGARWCNPTYQYGFGYQADVWYYDGGRVYQQIGDYTLNPSSWTACGRNVLDQYGPYLVATQAQIPQVSLFPHGLAMDYWRTGNPVSRAAVLNLSTVILDWTAAWHVSAGAIRETSYWLESVIKGEQLGATPVSPFAKGWLVDILLGHIDQLYVSDPWQFNQPAFGGIVAEALIDYYEQTHDPRVPPAVKKVLDWLWTNAYDQAHHAMAYDPTAVPVQLEGGQVLDNLIAPAYAWYWSVSGDDTYRQRGDDIFAHALDVDINWAGKIYSQNFKWSFDYVRYRSGLSTSMTDQSSSNPLRPTLVSFQTDVRAVAAGQPLTLRWQTQNATAVSIVPTVLGSALPVNGSITVTPSATTKYVLTATNATGSVFTSAPEVSVFTTCGAVGAGTFRGCYYTDADFSTLQLSRVDNKIDFWGSPITGNGSARWESQITFSGGITAFTVYSGGQGRLLIDGKPLIDDWDIHDWRNTTQCASPGAGTHDVILEYRNTTGNSFHVSLSSLTVASCPVAPPSTPRGLSLNAATPGQLTAQWTANNETNLIGYYLYRSTGAAFVRMKLEPLTGITLTDYGLTAGSTYWYEVSAINSNQLESPFSAPVSSVANLPLPSPPPTTTTPAQPLLSNSLSSVKVYPNPWRSDKHAAHAFITFDGLTVDTSIKIFTISGHEVKKLHTDGPSIVWPMTNDSSDKVGSGIYPYLVTNGQGGKLRGKLAIIK